MAVSVGVRVAVCVGEGAGVSDEVGVGRGVTGVGLGDCVKEGIGLAVSTCGKLDWVCRTGVGPVGLQEVKTRMMSDQAAMNGVLFTSFDLHNSFSPLR